MRAVAIWTKGNENNMPTPQARKGNGGRGEGARRALRKERDARVEAEGEVGEDGRVESAVFIYGRVRDW